jgi:plastocyanin
MGKIIAAIIVVVLLVGGGYGYMQMKAAARPNIQPIMGGPAPEETVQPDTQAATTSAATTTAAQAAPVKEFTMTAYYDKKGKWFSLKTMEVKKGDMVRIKITNTAGMHDFSLDEYGIKKELPLNQEVVVEFTADKAGTFEYYCSMPGHKAAGQRGTLTVTE